MANMLEAMLQASCYSTREPMLGGLCSVLCPQEPVVHGATRAGSTQQMRRE